jgi:hypothetical protein
MHPIEKPLAFKHTLQYEIVHFEIALPMQHPSANPQNHQNQISHQIACCQPIIPRSNA